MNDPIQIFEQIGTSSRGKCSLYVVREAVQESRQLRPVAFAMTGRTGINRLDFTCTNADRLGVHWQGFCENNRDRCGEVKWCTNGFIIEV
ncbi:hypothetical protein ACW5WQ_21250 [Aeromonas rivuli]|jgi:hypothetical protein|uniref:hypothetical protein n=1 Tax=Aeromonas TaxID=642 RepID=UPI000FAA7E4C|nr:MULTISPECIES: hypothetical protein [Aeromonas]MBC8691055.1 hypothetical protein [Aeromonas hydrophila]